MWRLLQSGHFKPLFSLTQRQLFLGRLCLIALMGHLLVMIICTYAYIGYHEQERFIISSKHCNRVYVLSPLHKKIEPSLVAKAQKKQPIQASKVIDYKTYEALQKKEQKMAVKPQSVKKVSQKEVSVKLSETPKNKAVSGKKDTQLQTLPKAQLVIKNIQTVQKENAQKGDIKTKKAENSIKEEKKVTLEKKPSTALEQPSMDHPNKSANNANKISEKVDSVVQEEVSKVAEIIDPDEVTFIGYEQLDSLVIQNKIQRAIEQNFKAPIGIKKDVSCELSVRIGADGKVSNSTFIRSSGVLVYDTSARSMLQKIEFPKEVWNKTITIVLGQ